MENETLLSPEEIAKFSHLAPPRHTQAQQMILSYLMGFTGIFFGFGVAAVGLFLSPFFYAVDSYHRRVWPWNLG